MCSIYYIFITFYYSCNIQTVVVNETGSHELTLNRVCTNAHSDICSYNLKEEQYERNL